MGVPVYLTIHLRPFKLFPVFGCYELKADITISTNFHLCGINVQKRGCWVFYIAAIFFLSLQRNSCLLQDVVPSQDSDYVCFLSLFLLTSQESDLPVLTLVLRISPLRVGSTTSGNEP